MPMMIIPVLKSYYIDETYWGNSSDAQHEQIVDSFINNIANGLKELQPGLPDQYYNDMAWGTLQGTAAYNYDIYLNEIEKDRIGKERSSEKNNQKVGEYAPKGLPCNK